MRRQAEQGGQTAGSTAGYRLDPFALPVRYSASLAGAARDDAASILLEADKATVRRRVSTGVSMLMTVPIKAFRGVAVRIAPDGTDGEIIVTVELLHEDPELSLPLAIASDPEDIAADWQAWGRMFDLPLLIVGEDGAAREAVRRTGSLVTCRPASRRRPANLTRRRPRFLGRRKTGRGGEPTVLSGREIIARD